MQVLGAVFCVLSFLYSIYYLLLFILAMQASGRSSVVITETEADDDGYADGLLELLSLTGGTMAALSVF
jgi:hypothetical protein